MNRAAEQLLESLPVRNVDHFGRTLRDHLLGTHDLLHRWGNAEPVCLAGLFHSIYGTKTFQTAVLAENERERVRGAIGTRAEALVFIFAMSDRKRLLLENQSAPYGWIDHRTGARTEIPGSVLNDLVELEVANFLEQMPALTDMPDSMLPVFDDMQHRFEHVVPRMSSGARAACAQAFQGWRRRGNPERSPTRPSPGRPLGESGTFLVSANVRAPLSVSQYLLGPGRGQAGDLILGHVIPTPGDEIAIRDQDRVEHRVTEPTRVLAVLGGRDSSTHVCATIPTGGLDVEDGLEAHWIGGASGIVGCLERQPGLDANLAVESAADFRCDGLVLDSLGQPVNIGQFAIEPPDAPCSTPIVLVAGTSTECGKTVLAGELIRRLADTGLRVGAIKVSGTGGVLDSMQHERSGAVAVLDNVDAGLITTHCDSSEFHLRIPLLFRQMESFDVELIVAELGGDLLSANNPEFFRIDDLVANTMLLLVVSNDALGAVGVNTINEARLGFPKAKLRHITSPFRNHTGMKRRMATAGIPDCYDPRSSEDLASIVEEIVDKLDLAGRKGEK